MLSTIDGVARVQSQGGAPGEYRIEADPAKLWANGLSIADVAAAVAGANALSASGRVEDEGKLLLVLTQSRLTEPRQIENVVVKTVNGTVVRVGDVATVTAAPEPQWIRVSADGRDAVLVNVYQQPGGNTVEIARQVRAAFERMRGQGPADMQVKAWYDQSDLILDSAAALRNAIVIGVVLAALVLLVFLRNWRVTLAAVVAVPVVLAAATLVLKLIGQSYNIMTLGGMAAAIGLIIDDAIVMIEHIERRLADETRARPTGHRARGLRIHAPARRVVGGDDGHLRPARLPHRGDRRLLQGAVDHHGRLARALLPCRLVAGADPGRAAGQPSRDRRRAR